MATHRVRIEYDAEAPTPRGVLVEAERLATEAFGEGVNAHVEVGRIYEDASLKTSHEAARQITRWRATVKATADVEVPGASRITPMRSPDVLILDDPPKERP